MKRGAIGLAGRLAARCLPPELREAFLGDLAEELERQRGRGAWRTRLFTWRQAASALPLLLSGARRQPRPPHVRLALRDWSADVRVAVRALRASWGFTALATLVLALGIGGSTAMFTLVHSVLVRPLPHPESERLVWLWDVQPDLPTAPLSAADYLDYREARSFENLAALRLRDWTLLGGGPAERVSGGEVSDNFFATFGVAARLGRTFVPADGQPGAARVAVLKHGFFEQRFGGDPDVIGRTLTLNGAPVTVVGVLPPEFSFMREGQLFVNPRHVVPDVFATDTTDWTTNRRTHYLLALGRLRLGVSLAQARADLDQVVARIQAETDHDHGVALLSLHEYLVGHARPALLALFVAVGLVLAIACANVANLLLARSLGRRRELALRAALGAARPRLVRMLLVESVLLGLAGGALGALLAAAAVRGLVAARPSFLPRLAEITLDPAVLVFAFLLSLFSGVLFGLVPALHTTVGAPRAALAEGERTGVRHGRLRGALVAAEVALATIVLAGAGVLLASFEHLLRVELGYQALDRAAFTIVPGGPAYAELDAHRALHRALLERVAALPGVDGVAIANDQPLLGQDTTSNPEIQGREAPSGEELLFGQHGVNQSYFEVMGIPLLAGRTFDQRDGARGAPVIIVNRAIAERFFPGESALGRRLRFRGDENWREIVGVVGAVRYNGLANAVGFDTYTPFEQTPFVYQVVTVKSALPLDALRPVLQRELARLDPEQALFDLRTLEEVRAAALAERGLPVALFGLFGVLALVLAALGLYAVLAYLVGQRRREIGIRLALGARPFAVVRLVAREGLGLVAIGLGVGIVLALLLNRLLEGLLFGVTPQDPRAFVLAALALGAAALLACWVPTWRALRVDPVDALRPE